MSLLEGNITGASLHRILEKSLLETALESWPFLILPAYPGVWAS